MSRYVTAEPFDLAWEEVSGKTDPEQRYAFYRVCLPDSTELELLGTCETEEAVGVMLVQLGRDGELNDCPHGLLDRTPPCAACNGSGDDCSVCLGSGIKPTGTWLWRPWRAMPRELSEAGRVLGSKTFGITREESKP